MSRLTKALIIVLAVAGIIGAANSPHIEEDEPGWNCATMGNRICGPINGGN